MLTYADAAQADTQLDSVDLAVQLKMLRRHGDYDLLTSRGGALPGIRHKAEGRRHKATMSSSPAVPVCVCVCVCVCAMEARLLLRHFSY
jgi:hypothetical protein